MLTRSLIVALGAFAGVANAIYAPGSAIHRGCAAELNEADFVAAEAHFGVAAKTFALKDPSASTTKQNTIPVYWNVSDDVFSMHDIRYLSALFL
jgi:hypothetical protein